MITHQDKTLDSYLGCKVKVVLKHKIITGYLALVLVGNRVVGYTTCDKKQFYLPSEKAKTKFLKTNVIYIEEI